ncbi:hypothetical protein [Caulobacter sp. FWC26]|nr:hypothetical protein [Caulobacter sp. FWC26]
MRESARLSAASAAAGTGADVVRRRADGTWIYAIDNPFGVARPTR